MNEYDIPKPNRHLQANHMPMTQGTSQKRVERFLKVRESDEIIYCDTIFCKHDKEKVYS